MPRFTNDYAKDGKSLRAKSREEAGYRCARCGHPCETGVKRMGRGEWSDCDAQCAHGPPVRLQAEGDLSWVTVKKATSLIMPIADFILAGGKVQAQWRILTVHHFDGDKANDAWWNHLSLCQRCHLSVQTRVNPEIPWMFEHSEWLKPYVAGFYAHKYEGKNLTRGEVMERLDELLAFELRMKEDAS